MYPNLQYRTAGDADVRPEHARLNGLILPINDPFWLTHTPPLGFGCRCELVQTDEPVKRKEGYKKTTAPKGFDFNPGIDQKLFSDNAGYYISAPKYDVSVLISQAEIFVSKISKQSVISFMKEQPSALQMGKKTIQLSNADVRDIVNKPHENRVMRNALLFDIKNVLKDAKLVYSKAEGKGRPQYAKWHYYRVKGFDDMYLNIAEMEDGTLKLHSITDQLRAKK